MTNLKKELFAIYDTIHNPNELYEYIIDECKKKIDKVETGGFGADMKVSLINDGPVTIILEKK